MKRTVDVAGTRHCDVRSGSGLHTTIAFCIPVEASWLCPPGSCNGRADMEDAEDEHCSSPFRHDPRFSRVLDFVTRLRCVFDHKVRLSDDWPDGQTS